jgi:membrane-associated phospholipid phosphatase
MTVATPRSPVSSGRIRAPGPSAGLGIMVELAVGFFLVGCASLAGLVFVHRPWPNRLDVVGYLLLPANLSSSWAQHFASLGSMSVLISGVLVVFLVGIWRDRVRAIACAIAPVIAVLVVQEIAKPLVDRPNALSGGLSYPSGTVTAVAALATAVTLVMPLRVRFPVAVLGLLSTVGTAAAVVVLRWHYPTDALGGVAVGSGSVLVIDALARFPKTMAGLRRSRHRSREHLAHSSAVPEQRVAAGAPAAQEARCDEG